jgi:tetratricopeptide (TPR) repeat protein
LQSYRELGEVTGQAAAWDSLGSAHHALGRFDRALHHFGQALRIVRDVGDRYNEASILGHMGDAHEAAGEPATATEARQQALAILDGFDHSDAAQLRALLASAPISDLPS